MDRAERLLDLVTLLLNAEQPVSFREIREHFEDYGGVSRDAAIRKFERDKADLLELGIPLEWVEPDSDAGESADGGGYRVQPSAYFLPPIDLTPEELALLTVAGAAAHGMEGFPWPAEVARALEKITFAAEEHGTRPAPIAERLAVHTRPRGDPATVGAHFAALRDAIARRKTVTIAYHGLQRDAVEERDIEPYGLFLRNGTWSVFGWCRLRKDRRTFHLDRIQSLKVNKERPKTPDYRIPDDVDLEHISGQRTWEYTMDDPVEVTLRLEPHLAFSAASLFGTRSRVHPLPDDRAEVTLVSTNLDALIERVLSLRDGVMVVGPPEVRSRVIAQLEAVAARGEAAP